jgi:predicted oxidoreductase
MEMEMSVEMNGSLDRLAAAAEMLEAAVARLSGLEARVIEVQAASMAVSELEEKLVAAEARIAELTARGAGAGFGSGAVQGRKTLQAKGTGVSEGLEGGIDAALGSLSLEQRIAVKSQLMRSGLLG